MIVEYKYGDRGDDCVYVTFGENRKFANRIFASYGWLYRKGGRTLGGGGLPPVKYNDKPTFYFSVDDGNSIHEVFHTNEGVKHTIVEDESTRKELIDMIIFESNNGNSNYYMEPIIGYYGL